MHTPPIFNQVHDDADLTRTELRVWRAAAQLLDWVELRELKLAVLERATGLSQSRLSEALGRLTAHGYLVRGPRLAGERAARYRVPLSRAADAA